MCEEIIKILTQSENENQLGLRYNRNSPFVGAKRSALRPHAGVSCNLIYRTKVGSSYV